MTTKNIDNQIHWLFDQDSFDWDLMPLGWVPATYTLVGGDTCPRPPGTKKEREVRVLCSTADLADVEWSPVKILGSYVVIGEQGGLCDHCGHESKVKHVVFGTTGIDRIELQPLCNSKHSTYIPLGEFGLSVEELTPWRNSVTWWARARAKLKTQERRLKRIVLVMKYSEHIQYLYSNKRD